MFGVEYPFYRDWRQKRPSKNDVALPLFLRTRTLFIDAWTITQT